MRPVLALKLDKVSPRRSHAQGRQGVTPQREGHPRLRAPAPSAEELVTLHPAQKTESHWVSFQPGHCPPAAFVHVAPGRPFRTPPSVVQAAFTRGSSPSPSLRPGVLKALQGACSGNLSVPHGRQAPECHLHLSAPSGRDGWEASRLSKELRAHEAVPALRLALWRRGWAAGDGGQVLAVPRTGHLHQAHL